MTKTVRLCCIQYQLSFDNDVQNITRRFWLTILKKFLDQEIASVVKCKNWNSLEMRIMPNHIHIFIV